jgi:hypothetical protein
MQHWDSSCDIGETKKPMGDSIYSMDSMDKGMIHIQSWMVHVFITLLKMHII